MTSSIKPGQIYRSPFYSGFYRLVMVLRRNARPAMGVDRWDVLILVDTSNDDANSTEWCYRDVTLYSWELISDV